MPARKNRPSKYGAQARTTSEVIDDQLLVSIFGDPEYVDCTCGHPNADHVLDECPFPGCGCGVIDPRSRPGERT